MTTVTFAGLVAAARRERWAPRIWWGVLAAAFVAQAWWGVQRRFGGSWGRMSLLLLAAAWLAPLIAVASLKGRRPENAPPDSGDDASPEAWREARTALLDMLLRAWPLVAKSPFAASAKAGIRDLRKIPRRAIAAELAERVERVRREAWVPLRDRYWELITPVVDEIRDDFALHDSDDSPDPRLLALQDALAEAAAAGLSFQRPYLLASDLRDAARLCASLALTYASLDARAIPLAAAIALEWADFSRPWLPATACETAARRVGVAGKAMPPAPAFALPPRTVSSPVGTPSDAGCLEPAAPAEPGTPRPAAPQSASMAAASPVPAHHGHRRRVKVWRKSRRRHSAFGGGFRTQMRRIADIFAAFFQRVRYFLTSWWIYRR